MTNTPKIDKDVFNNKNNELIGDGFIEVDGAAPAHKPNRGEMSTNRTIDDGGNLEDTDGPFTNSDDSVLRENITNSDIATDKK